MGEHYAVISWGTREMPEFPEEKGQKFGSWIDNWVDFVATCPPAPPGGVNARFESSSPDAEEDWYGMRAKLMMDDPSCWSMMDLQPHISHAKEAWEELRRHVERELEIGLPIGEILIAFDRS